MKKKIIWLAVSCLIVVALLLVSCDPAVEEEEGAEVAEVAEEEVVEEENEVAPAKFEVISLNIEPLEAMAGETVSITAVVENIGGSEGTYAVILTVDGVDTEAREVAITPGSSKVVTFSLVEDAPGTYGISIGGLTSALIVEEEKEVAPAKFEVISLSIEPLEAMAGETVSITAVVENIGGSEGTYAVILAVDGVDTEAKEVAITPGSSQVATFSLVSDEPGTYEISIGGLTSALIVKEELKYDDGTADGLQSVGGPGFLVHFTPPATPFEINSVKVFTVLWGSNYENQEARFEIWDKNFKVLHYWEKPATTFSHEPNWETFEIQGVSVDDDFYVVFYPYSTREGGVYLHYDSSQINNGSEWAGSRGGITDWIGTLPKATTNWMIRVVGTPTEEGTPATSPPTSPAPTIEVSAEFQETINSLDSPLKLSQWMIENIKSESYYEREKQSGTSYTPTPQETFEARSGNCRVFAVFACYILQYHGYEAEILGIKVESDERMNHVVCVYRSDGSLYVINNGRMEGPYQNYEDIASAHHGGWSSYEIHYSWESYQQLKRPDEIVYR